MSAAPDAKPVPVWPATLPPMPVVDFALFGEVETVPLPRHQKLVASFLSRNWAQIPHVTHHDEAEAPTLDTVRKALGEQLGIKLTPVPFLIKAAVKALQAFPRFNASLAPNGDGAFDDVPAGVRDQVKVMVGGAPLTQSFADSIGADGYSPDAASAADLAVKLMVG